MTKIIDQTCKQAAKPVSVVVGDIYKNLYTGNFYMLTCITYKGNSDDYYLVSLDGRFYNKAPYKFLDAQGVINNPPFVRVEGASIKVTGTCG